MSEARALTFDVFGTVVDWRTSIAREGRAFGARHGIEADWERFAEDDFDVVADDFIGLAEALGA